MNYPKRIKFWYIGEKHGKKLGWHWHVWFTATEVYYPDEEKKFWKRFNRFRTKKIATEKLSKINKIMRAK